MITSENYIRRQKIIFYQALIAGAISRLEYYIKIGDYITFEWDNQTYSGTVVKFEKYDLESWDIDGLSPFSSLEDQLHLIKLYVVIQPDQDKKWTNLIKADNPTQYKVHHEVLHDYFQTDMKI